MCLLRPQFLLSLIFCFGTEYRASLSFFYKMLKTTAKCCFIMRCLSLLDHSNNIHGLASKLEPFFFWWKFIVESFFFYIYMPNAIQWGCLLCVQQNDYERYVYLDHSFTTAFIISYLLFWYRILECIFVRWGPSGVGGVYT